MVKNQVVQKWRIWRNPFFFFFKDYSSNHLQKKEEDAAHQIQRKIWQCTAIKRKSLGEGGVQRSETGACVVWPPQNAWLSKRVTISQSCILFLSSKKLHFWAFHQARWKCFFPFNQFCVEESQRSRASPSQMEMFFPLQSILCRVKPNVKGITKPNGNVFSPSINFV